MGYIKKMVNREYAEMMKKELLIEKLECASRDTSYHLNTHVSSYYENLSQKFNHIVLCHVKRANNGFRYLTLAEKLKEMERIKPIVDRIARINDSNNPHIGASQELAEEYFYAIRKIYKPLLREY